MPDDLDPKKYHIVTTAKVIKCKKCLLFMAVLAFLVVPFLSFNYYKFAINRQALQAKETTFEIYEGESVGQIASRLSTEALVNSEFLFKFYLVTNSLQNAIQAGNYKIPAGASVVELAEIFQHGTNDISITFLEGWRVEEFALEAASKFAKVDFEDFVRLARENEGSLFPDTYLFNASVDEDAMVKRLQDTFEEKTSSVLTEDSLLSSGLTKEEVLVFASIVEREVHNPEDRPLVAGVLIKRWRNGELIGADATTQYAIALKEACSDYNENLSGECIPNIEDAEKIDWWPVSLSIYDLENASPYNTRKNSGLPPAPIANPGISSIEAVLNATITSYNYYLTDTQGVTHYADTLEQHNANVAKYL